MWLGLPVRPKFILRMVWSALPFVFGDVASISNEHLRSWFYCDLKKELTKDFPAPDILKRTQRVATGRCYSIPSSSEAKIEARYKYSRRSKRSKAWDTQSEIVRSCIESGAHAGG